MEAGKRDRILHSIVTQFCNSIGLELCFSSIEKLIIMYLLDFTYPLFFCSQLFEILTVTPMYVHILKLF